jgi:hypothetical protein
LVRELVARDFVVHRYREVCGRPGVRDEEWVPTVVSRGWVIITTDRGRGDKIILKVLARHKATAIMLAPKGHPTETAQLILENQRKILRVIETNAPPLGLYVCKSGITAHDFERGGPRLRVLGNGKLKGG